ncbi:UNVERIFIED_CONTAM: hypothetical protein FKN15_002236 [Acipenser sinensis]
MSYLPPRLIKKIKRSGAAATFLFGAKVCSHYGDHGNPQKEPAAGVAAAEAGPVVALLTLEPGEAPPFLDLKTTVAPLPFALKTATAPPLSTLETTTAPPFFALEMAEAPLPFTLEMTAPLSLALEVTPAPFLASRNSLSLPSFVLGQAV